MILLPLVVLFMAFFVFLIMHIWKKSKIAVITLVVLLILSISIVIDSVARCGIWNFVGYPYSYRVSFFGREYFAPAGTLNVKYTDTFADDSKPIYEISSIFNKLTGKRFFILKPKKEDFAPTVIYLHVEDDKYLAYTLSGGN